MELSQLARSSGSSVFVAQGRSDVCRPRAAVGVSVPGIRQSRGVALRHGSVMESVALPGRGRVRCESLQEGRVGSVEEKTTFVNRLEGGAEDTRQSGGNDDGLARAKLAVFVSGGGSNFRAIHAGCKKNAIHGDVAFVVSDKPGIIRLSL